MAFDRRWTGVNVLPVTLLLFIFSITVVGLCAAENISRLQVVSLITLGLAVAAVIHTILDTYLYFTSRLNPVYVLVVACIFMPTWLGIFVTAAIELTFIGRCNPGNYSDTYWDRDFDYETSCRIPRGRMAFSFFVFILYIATIVLSSICVKRERRARFEKRVNDQIAVCRSTNPPAMACPNCGTQMVATQQYVSIPAVPGALPSAACDDTAAPDYYAERDHKVLFSIGDESKD